MVFNDTDYRKANKVHYKVQKIATFRDITPSFIYTEVYRGV